MTSPSAAPQALGARERGTAGGRQSCPWAPGEERGGGGTCAAPGHGLSAAGPEETIPMGTQPGVPGIGSFVLLPPGLPARSRFSQRASGGRAVWIIHFLLF